MPPTLETRFKAEFDKQWKVGINPNGGGFFLKVARRQLSASALRLRAVAVHAHRWRERLRFR
jgi:hypothetical protein